MPNVTSGIKECEMKKRVVIKQVPWINKLEFETVYTKLYSKNPIDQRWAVDRISEWSAKNPFALPLSVEATGGLVRATIQDYRVTSQFLETEQVQNNNSVLRFDDLTYQYCAAVIRFVNLITERGQKTEFRCTVRQRAYKLGIPDWIVQLRHQAAHALMPPLDRFRLATQICLNWLDENYWKPALANTIDVCIVNDDADYENKCQKLLSDFQRIQYQCLFGSKEHSENREARHSLRQIVYGIAPLIKKKKKIFISTLAKPEFLLSLKACSKPLVEGSDCFIKERTVGLPSTIKKFWQPVISAIHERKLISDLVLTLLKVQKKLGDEHQRLAFAWIWKILDACTESWGSQERSFDGLEDLRQCPPVLNWFELLDVCLHNTSKYTPAILPLIVEHIYPPIPQSKINSLMGLVAIYTGALVDVSSTDNVSTDKRLYGVEDVKTVLELQDVINRGEKSLLYKENKWKLCDEDIDWENVPLGITFSKENAVMNPTYLELREISQEEVENTTAKEPDVAAVDVSTPLNENEELSANTTKTEENMEIEENDLPISECRGGSFGVEDVCVW